MKNLFLPRECAAFAAGCDESVLQYEQHGTTSLLIKFLLLFRRGLGIAQPAPESGSMHGVTGKLQHPD